MTYDAFELSTESGAIVELYDFVSPSVSFRYTNIATPVTFNGNLYEPEQITNSAVKQTADIFKSTLKITFPRSVAFAASFLGFPPEDTVLVALRRGHVNDPDQEFVIEWQGRVIGAKATQNTVDIECESIFTSLRRNSLRQKFEIGCRHTLYDSRCTIDKELFKLVGTVSTITNNDIIVTGADGQPDGYWTGGIFLADNGVSRLITNHVGTTVTISRGITGLAVSGPVTLYAGCDHLKATCVSKFNNVANFGGFPFIPTVNLFGGGSVV